jgi:hypothetical protein
MMIATGILSGAGMALLIGRAVELFAAIFAFSACVEEVCVYLLHVLVASSCALLSSFADYCSHPSSAALGHTRQWKLLSRERS